MCDMVGVWDTNSDYYEVVEVVAVALNPGTGHRRRFAKLIDPPNRFLSCELAEKRMKEIRRRCLGRWFKIRMNGGRLTIRY